LLFLLFAGTASRGEQVYPVLVGSFVLALTGLLLAVWRLAFVEAAGPLRTSWWMRMAIGGPFAAGWYLWTLGDSHA